jgi:hypothetical protein
MNLANTSAVLGLHRYGADAPAGHDFRAFHDAIVHELDQVAVRLTHFSAQGDSYSGKLTSIDGRTFEKLVQSELAGISGLSLAASPKGTDAPAFDHFVYASLGYIDASRELVACLVINEGVIHSKSREFQNLVGLLAGLTECDVGYAFSDEAANHPEFYVFGMNYGRLSPEDQQLLNAWYAAPPEERSCRLRDIHGLNVVNDRQLDTQISDGIVLRSFIEQQPNCALIPLKDDRRYLWAIDDDATLRQLRTRLRRHPIVIH